jgi:MFS family permease
LIIDRVTNTAPSKTYLASINGAAAAMGCLARSIGPLVAGRLFDWGLHVKFVIVPFWVLAGVALCGAAESILLADHPQDI